MLDDEAEFACKLLKNEEKDRNVTIGFARADVVMTRKLLTDAFPGCPSTEAYTFARAVCDVGGQGRVSMIELDNYFSEFKRYQDAIKTEYILNKLLFPKDVVPPPPVEEEEPSDWLYLWLKSAECEGYYDDFCGAKLIAKTDMLDPPLNATDLKELVNKKGDLRKILRMIRKLDNEEA